MPDELPPCRIASWADADRWADTVASAIGRAGAGPEAIVALTRGGWVPGRLIADRLGVHRMLSLRAQHWGVTARPSGKAEVTEGLSGPVAGLSILVVDDITDTGESLALAIDHVRAGGPARIQSAAFLHIAHSKFVPDYYGEEIPRDRWVWVVFPWNYWEDVRALSARAYAMAGSVEPARALLKERCGIDLTPAQFRASAGVK